jgi:type IV secretory pathway TrbF-like protein
MSKQQRVPLPRNAPLTAFEKARIEWFERYGSAIVDKNRNFLLNVLLAFVILALGYTIYSMMPLKRIVPYTIHVSDNGAVVAGQSATEGYKPGEKEINYFLNEWVKQVLTIDIKLTKTNIETAYSRTSGVAAQQLTEYLKKTQPFTALQATPDLVTTIEPLSLPTPIAENIVMIRVDANSRNATKFLGKTRYQITLHYALAPPTTDQEILTNPIGLLITDFKISEEIASANP